MSNMTDQKAKDTQTQEIEAGTGSCCAKNTIATTSACCTPPDVTRGEGGHTGCCGTDNNAGITFEKRRLDIEFLYLDLSVCIPCQGTESSLEEAIWGVSQVLEATGIEVAVHKINIQSEEQACELGFVSSPTIRINGRDIQLDVRESLCESCGDLCGDDVDCRIWVYQGKEYSVPPKAMIMEAILREVYGGKEVPKTPVQKVDIPDNLKRFFAAKQKKDAMAAQKKDSDAEKGGTGCCSSSSKCCC